MIDSKSVISQVQELQVLLHEIHAEGMVLSETFQVAAIIEKLPPTWNDFNNYLKHKQKEMNVEELIVRLRIEEDNKSSEKRLYSSSAAKANIIEQKKSSKAKRFAGGGSKLGPKKDTFKKKFLGKCYNCGGPGHKSSECKKPKRNREANLLEDISKEVSNMDICAVISEVNMVGSNPREWWIDTGATCHICYEKDIFATLDESENGEKLFMGNSATSDIKGQGKVIFKMTFGKELTLNNIRLLCPNVECLFERVMFVMACLSSIHERTALYSPQQNGVAGRKNRTLKEMMNALLLSFGLSQNMWGEAVLTEEEIYMEQPEGFSARGQENKMTCLSSGVIQSTKKFLNSKFDMKDLGLAEVILGIKIHRTSEGMVLSQSHYVDKILEKFNKDDSALARTLIDTSQHLSNNRGQSISQLEYSRIIGSLMYLMSCTRPDIAYAVSKLSRFTSNLGADHWKAIIRLLRYLRYTRDHGLHYTRYPAVIEGYSDANWISDMKDSKSTSGFVFTLGGTAIAWKSSKQTVIARSTIESEFIALDKCAEEAEWLRLFLKDVPGWVKPVPAICIHCDIQSSIERAQSNMYNGKSRHIRCRHNTIRQLLSTRVISIDYVKSKDNVADPLTKGLNRELIQKSSKEMGLKPKE
ncbi:uncharacterized protein [Henckelia pumila]|uniref:uncharacterized protein n=1 Tax=Henckelia pumila TaxID=405737 RepID=UPI003C6DDE2B